ncbi:protein PSK SIMULATOR 1-like [Macadamia integrifolia]|uniref:protein PSK SIMULATOR 1-like n=1 Tax=Macadamia integrifolia TaxID=60698 RepID=UPI001C4FE74E|nr:protein PSK SIMULATOR 1-like [Macadamia integrifolia]XP_042513018.1 protein PSK SIMULATOR 1-like [Macadamia integrifolia]
MVMESWFGSLWKHSRRNNPDPAKVTIGVLAFEVASLMTKVVHLWQCLSDKQVVRLREEIMNSIGVTKLVSDDDEYLVGLVFAEMVDNLGFVVRSVARLGKKCSDPVLQRFEHVFDELANTDEDPYGWELSWKKMDRKVRKMEKFIGISTNLYQELEVLTELEQTLRRMQASNDDPNRVSLLEFQQKVVWQRQEVKNLRERTLWNRTYDYTIRLLVRALFTIFRRIKRVFGINQMEAVNGVDDSKVFNSDYLSRSHSVSTLMQSSVHPSEKNRPMFSSGPLGHSISKSGPISSTKKASNRHQHTHENSSMPLHGKNLRKTKRLTTVGPFRGCMMGGSDTPVLQSYTPVNHGSRKSNVFYSGILNGVKDANAELLPRSSVHRTNVSLFSSKRRLLNAPPSTLGAAALALHYANVIIVIERLVTSSHLIGPDARDDLYNMLPTSVRMALRARLKSYAKSVASSFCDGVLAAEWNDALARILEWLAPLAHNMIRWHSERNFEQQNLVSRTNVLLVQTLYFANQAKTEAAITELLVGLNYIWRFGRDLNAKALQECTGSGNFDEYLDMKG